MKFLIFVLIVALVKAQPPVEVMLLAESLCPNCIDFLKNDLGPALAARGVMDIVDVVYIPWGNSYCETKECPSKTPGKYDVNVRVCWNAACAGDNPPADCYNISKQTCQHGSNECQGDRIEACAIGLNKASVSKWWSFLMCFEAENSGQLSTAQKCIEKAGLDWNTVSKCAESGNLVGDKFEIANAKATNAPGPHQGVPWAYVNGVHVENGMLKAICNSYQGTKPSGCN